MGNRPNIKDWMAKLTPEEKEAHYAKQKEKVREKARLKRELKQTAQEQALTLLPEMMARQMTTSKEWHPSDELLQTLRGLIQKGLTIQEMRSGAFKTMDQKSWGALQTALFKDHVGEIASMGLTLLESRKAALVRLKKRARWLRKIMRKIEKDKKTVAPKYFSELGACENEMHNLEVELAKTFYQIEAVGEKAKSGAINIHLGTPRPKPPEEKQVVEVNG